MEDLLFIMATLAAVLLASAAVAVLLLVRRRIAIGRKAGSLAAAGLTRFDHDAQPGVARAARISPRLCPVCRLPFERFDAFGSPGISAERPDARCPNCRSLERHRLAWLYLLNETDLFDAYQDTAVLHLCVERIVYLKLKEEGEPALLVHQAGYETAGEASPSGTLDHPSATFDVVYCSYVLQLVADDRLAMRELRRVLKPTGWALVQAPVVRERTEELAATRAGNGAPRRSYGPDIVERLTEAGLRVEVGDYFNKLGIERATRYGLMETESVYYCTPL